MMRASQGMMVLLIAGAFAAGCKNDSPTSANARSAGAAVADVAPPLPIASEPLTQRHEFTDDVSVQVRLKPSGRSREVVNIDDAQGAALVPTLRPPLDVWTYSTSEAARLRADDIRYDDGGLRFLLQEGDARADVRTRLIGDYNVANLLATIGGLRALGVSLDDAARACATLTPVPGRMDRVPSGADAPQVVVDYSHTPDALEKALIALRPFAVQRGGALWCVFGCGGNRDQGKRPLMGALAQRLADEVVATSDNPRNESPAFILLQIVAGLKGSQARVKVIEDRRAAIAHAVRQADPRDVILIAGKGHEDYQEVMGVKHHFSDSEEAAAALAQRAGALPS